MLLSLIVTYSTGGGRRLSLTDVKELADALAEATIAVLDFDFSGLRGDILGTFYQSYFDLLTRKAPGEFYTPPEMVDFMFDAYCSLSVVAQTTYLHGDGR